MSHRNVFLTLQEAEEPKIEMWTDTVSESLLLFINGVCFIMSSQGEGGKDFPGLLL